MHANNAPAGSHKKRNADERDARQERTTEMLSDRAQVHADQAALFDHLFREQLTWDQRRIIALRTYYNEMATHMLMTEALELAAQAAEVHVETVRRWRQAYELHGPEVLNTDNRQWGRHTKVAWLLEDEEVRLEAEEWLRQETIKSGSEKEPGAVLHEDGEDEFEVERVVEKRFAKDGVYFKIRWRGWKASTDTWEPAADLGHCRSAVEEYEKMLQDLEAAGKPKKDQASGGFDMPPDPDSDDDEAPNPNPNPNPNPAPM